MDLQYLEVLNLQLQSLIDKRQREIELLQSLPASLTSLFDKGCGFTEFLVRMFCYLSWSDIERCRLVCPKWKNFIDRFVTRKHPAISNYYRWTDGQPDYTHLFCGGEARHVCSDEKYIFCGMRGGKIMVFLANTFLFVTSVEEKDCFFWKLQAGPNMLVAVTEISVVIWDKETWKVAGKVKYWSEGEPYLHVDNNLIVAPGATKYTTRVLLFDKSDKTVKRIRDLVHRKFWVLGAYIENDKVLTLSVPACKSVSSRELSLWCILTGSNLAKIQISGAIGGFPAMKYPFAFLPSASKGLEVWNLTSCTRVRCISTNVFSYCIKNQFLFILNKHSKLKIFKVGEVTNDKVGNILWSREVSWPIDGPNIGSIPKFQVETSRVLVLTTTANAEDVLLIIKMNKNKSNSKRKEENVPISIADVAMAVAEFDTFDTEIVNEIDESPTIDYQEALIIEHNHNHLEDYFIFGVNVLHSQSEKIIVSEDFSFTLKIDLHEDPILDENNIDSYVNINNDDDDDDEDEADFTYTYEEVTDSEYEVE